MRTDHGLPLADLHVDPLVIPIGVDAEAGASYLEAVRQLRERYGPELHITGGVSNVSFGMPGAAAHQRHVPRPVRRRPGRTAASSIRSPPTSRVRSGPTATPRPTGSRRTC